MIRMRERCVRDRLQPSDVANPSSNGRCGHGCGMHRHATRSPTPRLAAWPPTPTKTQRQEGKITTARLWACRSGCVVRLPLRTSVILSPRLRAEQTQTQSHAQREKQTGVRCGPRSKTSQRPHSCGYGTPTTPLFSSTCHAAAMMVRGRKWRLSPPICKTG